MCVGCGTNLSNYLSRWSYEYEIYKYELRKQFSEEEVKEYELRYANLFFLKYNIDRECCRRFFITFNDYIPSTL